MSGPDETRSEHADWCRYHDEFGCASQPRTVSVDETRSDPPAEFYEATVGGVRFYGDAARAICELTAAANRLERENTELRAENEHDTYVCAWKRRYDAARVEADRLRTLAWQYRADVPEFCPAKKPLSGGYVDLCILPDAHDGECFYDSALGGGSQ